MINRILRKSEVINCTGLPKSTLYLRISQGLFTKPIDLGGRIVGWPESEIAALNAARISGKSDNDIRVLVSQLEFDRKDSEA